MCSQVTVLLAVLLVLLSPLPAHTADPELPILDTISIEVGKKGTLGWHHGRIVQVLDDDWLLVALEDAKTKRYVGYNVILYAPNTGKVLADGRRVQAGDWGKYLGEPPNVSVTETKRLKDTEGGSHTYYVLKPIR